MYLSLDLGQVEGCIDDNARLLFYIFSPHIIQSFLGLIIGRSGPLLCWQYTEYSTENLLAYWIATFGLGMKLGESVG